MRAGIREEGIMGGGRREMGEGMYGPVGEELSNAIKGVVALN